MVRRKGNGREGGVIRITPVSLGQMGIVAGIARIVAVSKPGKLILGKNINIVEVMLICLIERIHYGGNSTCSTAKHPAVIVVRHLLHRAGGVVAIEAKVVRFSV